MSLLSGVVSLVISTAKAIKGKVKFSEIIVDLMMKLPQAVLDLVRLNKVSSPEKLDEALAELDLRTGTDAGAFDIIRDLPADKEEQLFDHMKGMLDILGKNQLKVPGYFVEAAESETS